MAKRLPVPSGLEHLIEKRERERRAAESGSKGATAKPGKERRKTERRRKEK